MKISFIPINPIKFSSTKLSQPKVNLVSGVDEFVPSNDESKVFFVNMKHYRKDALWAKRMLAARDNLADKINQGADFEEVFNRTRRAVQLVNKHPHPEVFGKIRKDFVYAHFEVEPNDRGEEYLQKYKNKTLFYDYTPKSNDEYPNASTVKLINCDWKDMVEVIYGYRSDDSNNNLQEVKQAYDKLMAMENPSVYDINKTCATINWLIAQSSPFVRGNDSIASLLTKSIYKAYDVEISPLRNGISLDFEAFSNDLDDYIKKYPNYFNIRPHKNPQT